MDANTPGLVVGGLGFLLWWGGYYGAMVIAWRAGVRKVGIAVAAVAMGICGCFGIPILAYFWSKVQTKTYESVDTLPDDAPVPQHMNHFRIAAGVAVFGLVLQLVGGYMLPDDDGYDDYGSSYDDDYGEYEPGVYDEDDYEGDDGYEDEEPSDDESSLADDFDLLDEAEAVEEAAPAEEIEEDEPEDPGEATVRGLFLGTAAGARQAALLVAERVMFVSRERRQRWTGIEPGTTISVRGTREEESVVATEITPLEEDLWAEMPGPFVVRGDSQPLEELAGQYVLLGAPHAVTPTRLTFANGTELTVRAPRGSLARDTDYTAVRGVLIDTSAFARRGRLELWILREGDVVGL